MQVNAASGFSLGKKATSHAAERLATGHSMDAPLRVTIRASLTSLTLAGHDRQGDLAVQLTGFGKPADRVPTEHQHLHAIRGNTCQVA